MIDYEIWWLIPFTIGILEGLIAPVAGSILLTQHRIIQANLIAHSVLPGIVLGLSLEISPGLGGLCSGLAASFIAERLSQRFSAHSTAAMNTVLAGFTALGVLLIPLFKTRIDLEGILFGDLLSANSIDLIKIIITSLLLIFLVIFFYTDLVFIGVDQDGAISAKRPVRKILLLSNLTTSLVIINGITAVGLVLVIGLFCAPVIIHYKKSESLIGLMINSSITGFLLTSTGIILALVFDLPPGPLIGVLCLLLILFKK